MLCNLGKYALFNHPKLASHWPTSNVDNLFSSFWDHVRTQIYILVVFPLPGDSVILVEGHNHSDNLLHPDQPLHSHQRRQTGGHEGVVTKQ